MLQKQIKTKNMIDEKKTVNGLDEREARKRFEKNGPNAICIKKKISAIKILLSQFSDFMVLILLGSTIISIFMGETTESVAIISIVVLNSILGFTQEYKTEKTLDALKNLAAPTANVIRDGELKKIPAENIVVDDVLLLEAGDKVPADCILIEANNLQADESILTGESVPVEKSMTFEYDSSKKENRVYMGTTITHGRAKAFVFSTGMNTEMGKIAHMIQNTGDEDTPLQKRLDHLGKMIVYGCLVICAIVALAGIARGEDFFTMLLAGISLAVAAVPEGLPAIVTISLALGVGRMLKKNALIRKLPAVETLGCANVICSDKTGTLTENKMTVRKIYTCENMIEIEDIHKKEKPRFFINDKQIDPISIIGLTQTLQIGRLCNNATEILSKKARPKGVKVRRFFNLEDNEQIIGDPTETALYLAASKSGLIGDNINKIFTRVYEIPFDSDRKCMSVICKNENEGTYVFTKGAPDIIINKCNSILTANGIIKITPALKAGLMKINDSMAKDALRVIGVAYKKINILTQNQNEIEQDLTFAGLFGIIDPPRKEAVEAVARCKMAGVKPVMITGDHKITALAIAKEIGIFSKGDMVLSGDEIDKMKENEFLDAAKKASVYARVTPKHKLMIVRALKKLGNIVAMTGDGVNDAPALKEADIGISMGITGTDVTKEASSMILLDDNFATIVSAIEEGRIIYNNIRKFIRYMLACNIGEVLTMFLGMLMGLPLPLYPIQILWVNLVTDGLPAIALGFDPPEKDIMKMPPRGSKNNVFSQGLLWLIGFRGILIGVSTLLVFITVMKFTSDVNIARTSAFVTLVITQLLHVFECKSERKSIFNIPIFNNMLLVVSVAISLVMILGVVYIPMFQGIFKTVSLSMNEWVLILGFSALGPVLSSILKK